MIPAPANFLNLMLTLWGARGAPHSPPSHYCPGYNYADKNVDSDHEDTIFRQYHPVMRHVTSSNLDLNIICVRIVHYLIPKMRPPVVEVAQIPALDYCVWISLIETPGIMEQWSTIRTRDSPQQQSPAQHQISINLYPVTKSQHLNWTAYEGI